MAESKSVKFNMDTDIVINGKSKTWKKGEVFVDAPPELLKQVAREMQKKKNRRFEFA